MEKVNTSAFRFLGLIIGFFLITGSALGQTTQKSNKKKALTDNLTKSQISRDSNPAITLKLDRVPLKMALKRIAKQAEAGLYYNSKLLPKKIVNLNLQSVTLGEALRQVLEGTSLQVVTSGRNITLRQKRQHSPMQLPQVNIQETITGTVIDAESGETLPGVNILVKGTTAGTSTDSEGNFELAVESLQDTLVVSFIGFQTKDVPIEGRTEISIEMQSQTITGEEMVVVGYGTQRKSDLTGSVSSVTNDKISDVPVTDFRDALVGNISGAKVNTPTGRPGGNLINLQIRGTGSITAGNRPLYVVDGYPIGNDLRSINTNDIKSIDVLKDASAAAIYGSRGSNGVVLITTKRGAKKEPQVNVNVSRGFQQVTHKLDLMNAEQFAEFTVEARNNAYVEKAGGDRSDPNSERPAAYQIPASFQNPGGLGEGTNWQDEIFRTAPISDYTASVSGGNETIQYFVSGEYLKQQGIVRGTDFQKFNVRANLDVNVNDRFKVGLNISPSRLIGSSNHANGSWFARYGNIIAPTMTISPTIPIYSEDGSYTSGPTYGDVPFLRPENPVKLADQTYAKDYNSSLLGDAYAEYSILDELVFKTTLGTNLVFDTQRTWIPSTVANNSNPTRDPDATSNSYESVNWHNANTLTYQSTWSESHNFKAVIGFTTQSNSYQGMNLSAGNFPNDLIPYASAGTVNSGGAGASDWSLFSLLARLNYNYKQKYLVSLAVRRDGSSRFGAENKWGTFPSISLGWDISNEPFMESVDFISDLKLRASYGITGNNSIGNYSYISSLGQNNYVTGVPQNLGRGLAPNGFSNQNLGWETTYEKDIGLDLGFMNNRFNFTVDYYYRNTKDLLLSVNIPASTGYSTALQNIGEVRNKGWEFSLNSANVAGKNFQWNTDFNISFNSNEVLALGSKDERRFTGGYPQSNVIEVGKPIGLFWGYIQEGIFQNEEEIQNHADQPFAHPGDIKFKDVNGDGVINGSDQTTIGDPNPDFIYGMTNSFSYKNINLSVTISGVQGNDKFNFNKLVTENLNGVTNNSLAVAEDRWRSAENPGNGRIPRAIRGSNNGNGNISTFHIENGSYLRVSDITLGYRLPQSLIDRIGTGVGGARIYASAKNILTFTNYTGYDPELSNSGNNLTAVGKDWGRYPIAKTLSIGLNFTF